MILARREFLMAIGGAAACVRPALAAPAWRAGVASIDITPQPGLWMAGFAARKEPSQGVALPLHAKALALEDARGSRVVIVTLDLLGLTGPVVDRIAAAVERHHRIGRGRLLLCSSHTHSGPVIDDQLAVAYDLSPAQWDAIRTATRRIEAQVVEAVGQALRSIRPVRLRSGQSSAGFGANRRTAFPGGPSDPTVPVLSVERPDGGPLAVLFGYACHNTTLTADFVRFHGDYAGVAQAEIERRRPGTTALFLAGCGADQNPSPRGSVELVDRHGRALADAIDRALGEARPVAGDQLRAAFTTVTLDYAPPPPPDAWRARLEDSNPYVRRHAKLMLDAIARDGRVQSSEPAPLHALRIGDLTLVALSGEVVVDYALAIKRAHGDSTWVAGYTDTVFGYLPSVRVLREGGYEGGEAMLYFGRPGPFTESVERTVMTGVEWLLASMRAS
ncbi:MAG: neutral/alkaline non-lysosomal ceramidase N-terminal domain-containing protein [Acidobacteria bacterium]|nr:neutral/alkaline non-lysosomal ceramidase N-terminal domain-containing protein [Acidobacteriota bacterium]